MRSIAVIIKPEACLKNAWNESHKCLKVSKAAVTKFISEMLATMKITTPTNITGCNNLVKYEYQD